MQHYEGHEGWNLRSHSSFAVFLRNAGTLRIPQRCRGRNIHDSREIIRSRRVMDKHCLPLRSNMYERQIEVLLPPPQVEVKSSALLRSWGGEKPIRRGGVLLSVC